METPIVQCVQCAARLRLPAGFAARRFRCAKCGAINSLDPPATQSQSDLELEAKLDRALSSEPPAPTPPPPIAAPRPSPYAARPNRTEEVAGLSQAMAAANKSALRPLRWVFLLAIIPLAVHVFFVKKEVFDQAQVRTAFNEKLSARLADRQELRERIEKLGDAPSLDLLSAWADAFGETELQHALGEIGPKFDALSEPDRREVMGALKWKFMETHCGLQPPPLLSKDSWGHWGLAALAALLFLSYFCFAYPRGNATVGQLLKVGIFTGTIGIVLLFVVQVLARLATGFRIFGRGLLMLIWLILVAVAFSYSAAENPENGFFLSFIGFTLGIGLLEELCKLLPLIWHFRHGGELDWRGACIWGLASGAGFGVSEGIMYSARYYNGAATLEMYLVRFISCVAMHAAWAGSAAILLYRRQGDLQGEIEKYDWVQGARAGADRADGPARPLRHAAEEGDGRVGAAGRRGELRLLRLASGARSPRRDRAVHAVDGAIALTRTPSPIVLALVIEPPQRLMTSARDPQRARPDHNVSALTARFALDEDRLRPR